MNIFWHIAHNLYKLRGVFRPFARIFEVLNFIVGSNSVSAKCDIGEGTKFYHRGIGCVVHEKARIGKNCVIFQNVTIGSKWPNGICEGAAPLIADNVFIGAGAVILGAIHVGSNSIIGANAVVMTDVPDGMAVAGIPARSIKRQGR